MSIKEKVCVAQGGAQNKKCNASENTYYVFMRVTDETIRDFDLNPNDITWKLIGHEKCRVIKGHYVQRSLRCLYAARMG